MTGSRQFLIFSFQSKATDEIALVANIRTDSKYKSINIYEKKELTGRVRL